jgi:predicted DNA-binding transcriptional regulator AlpA
MGQMTQTTVKRDLIAFTEACDALCMHRNTGYALLQDKNFPVPVVLIGHRFFVRRRQLDRFLLGPEDSNGSNGEKERKPCPVCRRLFVRLDLHMRARHRDETDA